MSMSVLIPVTLAENLINVTAIEWGDFGLTVKNHFIRWFFHRTYSQGVAILSN